MSKRTELIKILKYFIKDEQDAVDQYVSLATLLKDYGLSGKAVQTVIEIARQEGNHYHILNKILGAIK